MQHFKRRPLDCPKAAYKYTSPAAVKEALRPLLEVRGGVNRPEGLRVQYSDEEILGRGDITFWKNQVGPEEGGFGCPAVAVAAESDIPLLIAAIDGIYKGTSTSAIPIAEVHAALLEIIFGPSSKYANGVFLYSIQRMLVNAACSQAASVAGLSGKVKAIPWTHGAPGCRGNLCFNSQAFRIYINPTNESEENPLRQVIPVVTLKPLILISETVRNPIPDHNMTYLLEYEESDVYFAMYFCTTVP
jgi:hypothetical protein